jgi:predicted transcriptional regulator of viral defense system
MLTVKKIHLADMKKIITYFKKHGGYALMKELKAASFQTRDIARLLKDGTIVKVKSGLYRLANIEGTVVPLPKIKGSGSTISQEIIDVCLAVPDGVICLASALTFYDLTTFNPSEIYVAIPNAAKAPKIDFPPLRVFYFRERFYKPGIEHIEVPNCTIKIYSKEKTICDMFRYRNKYGEDLALEGLKNYLSRKEANVNKLRKYAEVCQVKTVMMPYLKALVRQ